MGGAGLVVYKLKGIYIFYNFIYSFDAFGLFLYILNLKSSYKLIGRLVNTALGKGGVGVGLKGGRDNKEAEGNVKWDIGESLYIYLCVFRCIYIVILRENSSFY